MVDDDLDYTGLHAFVFMREVDPGTNIRDVIGALRQLDKPTIRYAAEMVGTSLGFAHVRTDSLAEMHDLIAGELWQLPRSTGASVLLLLLQATSINTSAASFMSRA